MTDNPLAHVRDRMAHAEDVDPGDVTPPPRDLPQGDKPPDDPRPDDSSPREAEAAQFPLNDIGNGRRFALYSGEDVMSVPRVCWFVWDGTVWAKDDDGLTVRGLAQKISGRMEYEIAHLAYSDWQLKQLAEEDGVKRRKSELDAIKTADRTPEQVAEIEALRARLDDIGGIRERFRDAKTAHRRHARATGNKTRIDAMLGEATVDLSCEFESLDADPLAVNTSAGVLRFSVDRPGDGASATANVRLDAHSRDDLLTKCMPVAHDEGATAKLFDGFMRRIQPDAAMRGFLQRWFGLSMTALTGDQKLVFLYGHGANGKSVLVELMARMLGDYAATAKIESLTGQNRRGGSDATPDLVPLMGARMVRAAEPEQGERMKEGIIKELTGGEPILVRALHSDFIEVAPKFKLTISGNHKPEIRGTDDGIWRRVLLAPFDVQIPEAERDLNFGAKLWEERAGILNWMVAGLIDYLEGGLQPPEAIVAATQMYREESDPVGSFLSECAEVSGGEADFTPSKELVQAFHFWLEERGEGRWTDRTVALRLKDKAGRWRDPRTGLTYSAAKRSVQGYAGLRLTDIFRRRMDDGGQGDHGRARSADEEAF